MSTITIKNETHWHELRKQTIGSSEVASLFDANPYLTRLELWLRKRGEIADTIPDTERMFWGRKLESMIGAGAAERMQWTLHRRNIYFIHDDVKGMGCTPDAEIAKDDDLRPGVLEIKNVDGLAYRAWDDGEPPLNYLLQLQHQLACTGYTWGAIAALIGGNDLKVFVYDRHEAVIKKIERAVTEFWQSVQTGEQPPAVADDYDIVRDLYAISEHKEIDLTGDNLLPELCARIKAAAERRKAADQEEKQCKALIMQKIGDATLAKCNGFTIKATQVNKGEYLVKAQSYKQLTVKENQPNV